MRARRTTRGSGARIAAIILVAGALAACSSPAAAGGEAAATGAAASGTAAPTATAAPTGTGTAAPAASGGPVAVTGTGRVQGKVAGAADEFLGIPYAAPPVGALRWAPPQPRRALVRDPARDLVRAALPADRVTVRAAQHVRGLPVPERVRPGGKAAAQTGR